jgi:hypothetical protein
MELSEAQAAYQDGRIGEVVIEPAESGNGWIVLVIGKLGDRVTLTDHSGFEKIYHDLDHATEAAKAIGAESLRIEEPF